MTDGGELLPPPAASPSSARAQVGTPRLLFRVALGGSALLTEWMGSALRAIDELPAPAEAHPTAVEAPARSVLIGALSSAMRWRPPIAPLETAARDASRAARRGLRLFANVPGASLVRRRYARARDGVASRLGRWAEEGAREERAGRRLAHLAAPVFFELGVARLSDSPELKTVIEEQSQGLAASSVAELRERSEDADRAIERVVRRVLRRPSKEEGRGGRARR
jgi:hypothetical protein